MKELNSVQKFYENKTIFITGGSGFMGKVMIEKLLYSCSDIKELIVLIRPKRGKNARQRVDDFLKLEVFKRVQTEKPEVLKKLRPVWGEVTEPNLGMVDEDLRYVIENTNIIFHLAASLKLENTLKPNLIINLTGTKNVVDVAKMMKNLILMMHTSTAFCNIEHEVVEEKVYDFQHRPLNFIRAAEWLSEEALAIAQKDILGVHPNTYTFTKRLAEILIRDEYKENNFPACIVRPSIVTPSYWEPVPGWVDSLNGPPGIVIAAGKGVLRTMLINPDATFEAIPVDMAVNGMLMFAKKLGTTKERSSEIPVCNITSHETSKVKYGYMFDIMRNLRYELPFAMSLWYPNTYLTQSKIFYTINVFLFQWIPAYFVDFWLWIFRQPTFMVRVQQKISVGMDVLKFFTMNDWNFKSDNYFGLVETQSKEEWEMFLVDARNVGNNDKYIKTTAVGGRQYCARDPLSTLPRARILIRIQYVIDKLCKILFFYFVIKYLLRAFGLME